MNKIHKSQYNESLGTWVAVPEIAKGRGKSATVAKDVLSASPSLPKFAVSALTLALLQVVSTTAYAADAQLGWSTTISKNCIGSDSSFSCGDVTLVSDGAKNVGTTIGSNIYANMSTAIGNDIYIGSKQGINNYNNAIKDAKEISKKTFGDESHYQEIYSSGVSKKKYNVSSGDVGKYSVALGNRINIQTTNTVAIGNNIGNHIDNDSKKRKLETKENSVFLGNNSGYIANDSSKSLGVDTGTTEQLRLSDGVAYAGASNVGGVVSIASGNQTRRIQGVAPGLVSENSADAINGAQLHAAYEKIDANEKGIGENKTNITKNTTDIKNLSQGWKINKANTNDIKSYAEMTEATAIKSGNTVNFVGSDTLTVALKKDENNNVAVKFDIDQDKLHTDSLIRLPVVYTDGDGNIVQRFGEEKKWYKISDINNANGDYSNLDDIDDNQIVASVHNPNDPNSKDSRGEKFKLTNLSEGDVREGSRDAINGSQLYASNQRIGKNETDIEHLGQGWNINRISAKDINSYADMTDATAIKAGSTVNFAGSDAVTVALKKDGNNNVAVQFKIDQDKLYADSLAQLPVVYTDGDGNIVQRGKNGKWYKSSDVKNANGDYSKLTDIGNNPIKAAIHNPGSENTHGGVFKLTNLDKGDINKDSTDAVNGSQLFADHVVLAGVLGGNAAAIASDGKAFTLDDKGKKVTAKSLDGLLLDGDFQAPTFTVNKANGDVFQIGTGSNAKDAVAHNVHDGLANLNNYVNKGITVSGTHGSGGKLTPTDKLHFADGNKTTATVSTDTAGMVTVKVDVDSGAITNDVLTQSPIIYTVKNGDKNAPVVKVGGKWYLAKDVKNGQPVSGAEAQNPVAINASLRNPENATEETAGKQYVLNNIADAKADFDAINKRQFDYAIVYGEPQTGDQYQKPNHSVVVFKGEKVRLSENGMTTAAGTGTQLKNVASAGDISLAANAGNAVNAGDLKYQVDSLTKKGLTFVGNEGSLVRKQLGETLTVSGGKNITVVSSDKGLEISTIDSPTFDGTVTAKGGFVAGSGHAVNINTNDDGIISGLTNVTLDNLHTDGSTSVAATEAQLGKVLAKIDGKIGDNDTRVTEGRVFSGDIGDKVKVGLGESLAVTGGITDKSKLTDGNIGVVTKENGLEIKLGKNLKDINSISLAASVPKGEDKDGDDGNNGKPKTDLDNNGIRIKPGVVNKPEISLTDKGLDNGGNQIKHVGDGEVSPTSTDAVNGKQLHAQGKAIRDIIGGTVVTYNPNAKDPDKQYSVKTDNIRTDSNGNPTGGIGDTGKATIDEAIRWVKNQKETPYVAGKNIVIEPSKEKPGAQVVRTDDNVMFHSVAIVGSNTNKMVKINGNGINAGDMKIRDVAPGQVSPLSQEAVNGSQLYQVRQDMENIDKHARSGIASAMATAGLPQAYLPGKSMVGAAASNYRGETAIAVGVSTISDNGKWLVKADANANRKDFGVSLGVGYQW